MTPDERHEDIVRRYPGGLTPVQYCHEALASADDGDLIDPPSIADWFTQSGILLRMWMDGLIELRGKGRDQPLGPWYITKKGRDSIAPSSPDAQTKGPT